jgi:hypothetical protein
MGDGGGSEPGKLKTVCVVVTNIGVISVESFL